MFEPLKIVELLTFKAEDRVVHDHADMYAFAIDYIAVHDRPPLGAPQQRLRLLAGDSETNRSLLLPLQPELHHAAAAAEPVAQREAAAMSHGMDPLAQSHCYFP